MCGSVTACLSLEAIHRLSQWPFQDFKHHIFRHMHVIMSNVIMLDSPPPPFFFKGGKKDYRYSKPSIEENSPYSAHGSSVCMFLDPTHRKVLQVCTYMYTRVQ